jgi:hypothetical protein
MVHLDGPALVLGQPSQRLGQAEQLLFPERSLAGSGLIRRQPGVQSGRGLLQRRFQRMFPGNVAGSSPEPSQGVGQVMGEGAPEKGGPLRLASAGQLSLRLVSFQKSLLDQVGGIQLRSQLMRELHPDEQLEIFPVLSPRQSVRSWLVGHQRTYQ